MKKKQAVATLYEGNYDLGVGALINSLVASQFSGTVFVGYRGNKPQWIDQLKPINGKERYKINDCIDIQLMQVGGTMHLTFVKPYFVQSILSENSDFTSVFYFDPDIVVNAPWQFYEDWVGRGFCLCLDTCFSILPYNHPWRFHWLQLGEKSILDPKMNFYVNAGFFGVTRNTFMVLEKWMELTDNFIKLGGNVTKFTKGDHLPYRSDQDILNAVLTCYPNEHYSIIGTEGMGFTFPAYLMSHAVGGNKKPWIKNCLGELLIAGKRVSYNERRFFENCEMPIRIFTPSKFKMKKLNLKVAAILGRLIGN